MTEVVAALIREGERFLICQRPPHKARGLLWEFVGGKVEPGETKVQALVRECREELGVTVAAEDVYFEVEHVYPDLTVHLTLFNARIAEGVPQLFEHNDLRWITPEEIPSFSFCPADVTILERMQTDRVREKLLALRDEPYRAFNSALLPTVEKETVIGVRIPALRGLAKELSGTPMGEAFLRSLPHAYYEENALHGFLLERIREPESLYAELERFLPYVDNWAVCDLVNPKELAKDPERLYERILAWIASDRPYTVRYGIGMLMRYFLDDRFSPAHLDLVAGVRWEEYYVNMMVAWYFATALAKQQEATLPYFTERRLPPWTHRKAIQKALESRRIPEDLKRCLKPLRDTQN
ncbi:MAG: NUDIX domain-containing protein [Oscillospiraceae bacterium]|nr:NUDIX domain-containing protein [Oscillospiraceae bacterium]